ncbi:MAG: citramalate synthase [Syntrophaceae bacterium]|jgi:2-isopropylmalate synthase|nr:citramalate synthase [Syntrophaceae bacterium]HOC60413.1 citramalate synthase [Smithellaceae bacterium]HQM45949.1 citramalate synthase [Smithellaceae bacterium]
MTKNSIFIYDTTLRDGTQGEQVTFSAEEKLRIARRLDEVHFHYIEGGWPGSNPKDMRFFEMAKTEIFKNAKLTAFSSTRKPHIRPEACPNLKALIRAETPAVAIFGKSWDLHVTDILKIDLDENLAMIRESVHYLKSKGKEVLFDAEHFFDGYKNHPRYATRVVKAALDAGADKIVFCDTNGGTMPHEIVDILKKISTVIPLSLSGIHVHNDCGLAVANSIAAVREGVKMVQGTVNGYGERCGNADLLSVIGNLQVKMKMQCLPPDSIRQLTNLSLYISDVANIPPLMARPFVGRSAFAHKGGVHVNAVTKNAAAYEHMEPELIGNSRRVLVSDMAGKSNIAYKAKALGIDLDRKNALDKVVHQVKLMEDKGFQFDAADGSLSVLMKKAIGEFIEPFNLECFSVVTSRTLDSPCLSLATIKISVDGEEELTAAEGNGPVNALDHALRKALTKFYPQIREMHLVDFKVRTLEGSEGTAAQVRVLLDSTDGSEIWSTTGVSENIIEASWQALIDSIEYKLSKDKKKGSPNRPS